MQLKEFKEKLYKRRKLILYSFFGILILLLVYILVFYLIIIPQNKRNITKQYKDIPVSIKYIVRGGLCKTFNECNSIKELDTSIVNSDIEDLKVLLSTEEFYNFRQSIFSGICPTAVDGNEYVYEISYNKLDFTVSSCSNDFTKYKSVVDRLNVVMDKYSKK
jgi:preprotein translocase subunit YajC